MATRILGTLLDIGRTRLELATVELEEERLRIARLQVLAACALFLTFVAVVLLVAWTVLVVDAAHRPAALGVLAAAFLLAALVAGWRWRDAAANKPPLLHATLAELRNDVEALRGRPWD